MLNNLFKPKWKNENASVREQAVLQMLETDEALEEMLMLEHDSKVRAAIYSKIIDVTKLIEIFQSESDDLLKRTLSTRIVTLLTGEHAHSPSIENIRQCLSNIENQFVLASLAQQAKHTEIRLHCINRLKDEEVLLTCALEENEIDVSYVAIDLIQSKDILLRMVKETKSNSKRLRKYAEQRLQQIEEVENLIIKRQEFLASMLEYTASDIVHDFKVSKIKQEWSEIADDASAEEQQQFLKMAGDLQQKITEREALLASDSYQHASKIVAQLELLLLEIIAASDVEAEQYQQWCKTADLAKSTWIVLDNQNNDFIEIQTKYETLLLSVTKKIKDIGSSVAQKSALIEFIEQLRINHKEHKIQKKDLEKYSLDWIQLLGANKQDYIELDSEFMAIKSQIEIKLLQAEEKDKQNKKEMEDVLQEVKKQLEQGNLTEVLKLYSKAEKFNQLLQGLPENQITQYANRFKRLKSKIEELKRWRKWSTNQVREELCAKLEAIQLLELEPRELAKEIQIVRDEWQLLDKKNGKSPEKLWQKFNTLAKETYKPCIDFFEKKKQNRQQHLQQREAICLQLEEQLANTSWDSTDKFDWNEFNELLKKAAWQWKKIGAVDYKQQKSIQQRFDAVMASLAPHIEKKVEQELLRRKSLIKAVESLQQNDDMRAAIRKVKEIQEQWKPAIASTRQIENELWDQFTKACDCIYQQDKSEKSAHRKTVNEALIIRQKLLDEIKLLGSSDQKSAKDITNSYKNIKQQWAKKDDVALPAKKLQECNNSFRNFEKIISTKIKILKQEESMQVFKQACSKEEVCKQLEYLVEQGKKDAEQLSAIKDQWQQSILDDAKLANVLEKRFERALKAYENDDFCKSYLLAMQNDQLKSANDLCFEIEELAEIDSPEEYKQARMAYKLAKLSDAMKSRSMENQSKNEECKALQRKWYSKSAIPAAEAKKLEERVVSAFDKLNKTR